MTEKLPPLGRRHALAGVAGVGLGAPLLAGCGGDGSSAVDPAGSSSASSPTASSSAAAPSGSGATPGTPLASTSEIEVGGGRLFADEKVVVTQPEEGVFKAFDATCTHQGCSVSGVEEGQIVCPCHFSMFSISDGSVEDGPAEDPLPEREITVTGDQISLL
jgi:Rieske Fe-S protein